MYVQVLNGVTSKGCIQISRGIIRSSAKEKSFKTGLDVSEHLISESYE